MYASRCVLYIIVVVTSYFNSRLCMGKKENARGTVHDNTGPDRCLGRGAPRNDPPVTCAVAQAIQSMQQFKPQQHTIVRQIESPDNICKQKNVAKLSLVGNESGNTPRQLHKHCNAGNKHARAVRRAGCAPASVTIGF